MKIEEITTRSGEQLMLYQAPNGKWRCPVCGSPELEQEPYFGNGAASFEMCSCGFEFGYDDDPAAAAEALPTVIANLERWRASVVTKKRGWPEQWVVLQEQLKSIGIS